MSKWRKLTFLFLLGFLFFEVLIIFPNRLEKKDDLAEKQKKLSQMSVNPEQTMKVIHLSESQKGNRDWELFAEIATGSQQKATWDLQKVRVQFYNKEKVEFTVSGDRGQIDGKSKNMTIEGNVVTQSNNGYTFKTEQVYYLSGDRRIRTPGRLKMFGPEDSQGKGMILTGNRMTILVEESLMKIEAEVYASKAMNDHKTLEIRSESAEFSGRKNEAQFLGKVKMLYGKMEIQGPQAIFSYQPKSNVLNSVLMKGGVQAKDAQKFASAENLTLDLLSQKIVFRGKPRLIQNNDELNGEEIVFLEGGKKVKVEKVKAKTNIQSP